MEPDPFNLTRFLDAQGATYPQALAELTAGRKRSHWMWFIFPQLDGLAFSAISKRYAIGSLAEARAYLDHPILGARLRECAEAVLAVEGKTALQMLGSPDDLKLRSCATLFAVARPGDSAFERILAKFYGGAKDERTLELLPSAD
jgi:uncharacterized protein (DUF1810 family)